MSFTRIKWIAILGIVVFVAIVDAARSAFYEDLTRTGGRLLMNGLIAAGVVTLLGFVLSFLERTQRNLEARNAELVALQRAADDISGELDLETVLQKVVDSSRTLIEARYGAVSVIDEDDRIQAFVTSGVSDERRSMIGDPPIGKGLLGVVLEQGERLRLQDLGSDPRSVGFPPNHPPMRSLLAVPVQGHGRFRGNLYLAEKIGGDEFDPSDEEVLVRFASQASLAIETARLHRRQRDLAVAEERLRLAHEMHDGLAQVLAYVGTKAQAVREYIKSGRTADATTQLDQLSTAARDVYGEVREGILALRTAGRTGRPLDEALADYLAQWQDQTGIAAALEAEPGLTLQPERELQVVRIAQEALANVRKHAAAQRVEVRLSREDDRLRLEVEDDGCGFDPDQPHRQGSPRFGLATMRERAQSIGADLRIESRPGSGTRIRLDFSSRPAV